MTEDRINIFDEKEERDKLIQKICMVFLKHQKGSHRLIIPRELYMLVTLDELNDMADYCKRFIKLYYDDQPTSDYRFYFEDWGIRLTLKQRKGKKAK